MTDVTAENISGKNSDMDFTDEFFDAFPPWSGSEISTASRMSMELFLTWGWHVSLVQCRLLRRMGRRWKRISSQLCSTCEFFNAVYDRGSTLDEWMAAVPHLSPYHIKSAVLNGTTGQRDWSASPSHPRTSFAALIPLPPFLTLPGTSYYQPMTRRRQSWNLNSGIKKWTI